MLPHVFSYHSVYILLEMPCGKSSVELVWKYGRLSSTPFLKSSIPFHFSTFLIPYRNYRSIPHHALIETNICVTFLPLCTAPFSAQHFRHTSTQSCASLVHRPSAALRWEFLFSTSLPNLQNLFYNTYRVKSQKL